MLYSDVTCVVVVVVVPEHVLISMFWGLQKDKSTTKNDNASREHAAALVEKTRRRKQELLQKLDRNYGALLQKAWENSQAFGNNTISRSLALDLLAEPLSTVGSWNVQVPPAKFQVVAGRRVPTVRGGIATATAMVVPLWHRLRRIAIEIHGPPEDMRINDPSPLSRKEQDDIILKEHEIVVVRLFRTVESSSSPSPSPSHHTDDDKQGTKKQSTSDSEEEGEEEKEEEEELPLRSFRVEDLAILDQKRNVCEVQVGHGDEAKVYDVTFQSEHESMAFSAQFNQLRDLESARSKKQAQLYKEKQKAENETFNKGSKETNKNTSKSKNHLSVDLLVEIVSATNLPGSNSSFGFPRNPFVIVKMGGSEVHRTKALSSTPDPVWSLETGSLFLVQKNPEDFFASTGGITFLISYAHTIATHKVIGQARVGLQQLLSMNGERERFDIVLEKDVQAPAGFCSLFLRIKQAVKSDIEVSLFFTLRATRGCCRRARLLILV